MNQSGNPHVRGDWDALVNERSIRRNIRRKPPVDKFRHEGVFQDEGVLQNRYNQLVRTLYVNMRPDDLPPLFRCTRNRVVLADLKSDGFWLEWSGAEIAQCKFVYGLVEMIEQSRDRIMRCPPATSHGR